MTTPTPTDGRPSGVRAALAALAFVLMATSAFVPFYFTVWRQDPAALHAYLTELPYRKVGGLRRLAVEANQRTPQGARVLFTMPPTVRAGAYDYAFGRMQYIMGGKDILRTDQKTIGEFDYIVCWSHCALPENFVVTWRSADGVVARRRS